MYRNLGFDLMNFGSLQLLLKIQSIFIAAENPLMLISS